MRFISITFGRGLLLKVILKSNLSILGFKNITTNANMMHINGEFAVGSISSLDDRVLELPYEVVSLVLQEQLQRLFD